MTTRTKVSYERCSIHVEGMDFKCPLCGVLVKSGESHECKRPKKAAMERPVIAESKETAFARWLAQVRHIAVTEAEHTIDPTAAFWRECFDGDMTPYQAFRESFTEQDGL